jgi:recombination protein RecT
MNAVAKTEAQAFQSGFDRMLPQIKAALPSHIDLDRFKRVIMMCVQKNPKLLNGDQRALFLACQNAAADGLMPDGREAVIIPRWNTKENREVATYQPMVGGLMKLARNSGEIASINSQVVYEGEPFKITLGDDERIEHERVLNLPPDAKIIGAYAVAVLKNGERVREFMTARDLEKVRNVNKYWAKGPWANWADEMSRKSAIRRLSKRLPLSTDRDGDHRLQNAIERTDDVVDGTFTEASTNAEAPRVGGKLAALEGLVDSTYIVDDDGYESANEVESASGVQKAEVSAEPKLSGPGEAYIEVALGSHTIAQFDAYCGSKPAAEIFKALPKPEQARVKAVLTAYREKLLAPKPDDDDFPGVATPRAGIADLAAEIP